MVTDGSRISNNVFSNNVGSSGDINIQTQKLIVRDSQVSASVFGSGNAGSLVIHATDSVELSGGGLFAQVDIEGRGKEET